MTQNNYVSDDFTSELIGAAQRGRFENIQKELRASGKTLSFKDFLAIGSSSNWCPLHHALRQGNLDRALDALDAFGEKFSREDFLTPDAHGWIPLDSAGRNGYLGAIFNPRYWVNRVEEMTKLWEDVPQDHKSSAIKWHNLDFDQIVKDTTQLSSPSGPKMDVAAFKDATRADFLEAGGLQAGRDKERV